MNASDFDFVRTFVRTRAAIVIEPGKEYLVESRLQTLARKENIVSVSALIDTLRSRQYGELHRRVVDALTTNETSFFRDAHPFNALRERILPELILKRRSERILNLWCGAASTGQECYSVLMLLAEHFPEFFTWNFNFLATDLSSEVLEQAKEGYYSQIEVNRGVPPALLQKYFTQHGNRWRISDSLRQKVVFREMNLVSDWPVLPPMDIVFLRNVLIYFDPPVKRTILGKVRRILRPGGYLFLGGAETTLNLDDSFERVVIDRATCYRNPSSGYP